MAAITYEHATVQYPGAERPSVNALDLDIADGEFLRGERQRLRHFREAKA